MGNIVLLDELTINKIAAGEVIERPASVVKEMMENSIDAGADKITVEVQNGGISYIRITDNGKGIMPDDMEYAFERLDLSARAYHRIIKVARTIADLEGEPRIREPHLLEAVGYRSVDRKFWNGE